MAIEVFILLFLSSVLAWAHCRSRRCLIDTKGIPIASEFAGDNCFVFSEKNTTGHSADEGVDETVRGSSTETVCVLSVFRT